MQSLSTNGAIIVGRGSASRNSPHPQGSTSLDKTLDVIKTEAEIAKLIAETAKINLELRWMPFVWASALMGAALAVVKFIGH
jgi:hypothetical protein